MKKDDKVYVAGHNGLVGSAIIRHLRSLGYTNLLTISHTDLNLIDMKATLEFFHCEKPEYVFVAAAKVGGINANNIYPADFMRTNLQIEMSIIDAAYRVGVKKLLLLGSSCIYPKFAPQPLREDYLLSGKLEPTNDAYAIAKIAGILMCKSYNRQYHTNFICAMPTNLYGPNDNYTLHISHVIPAMLRKFHEARIHGDLRVELWGTGFPRREFLYADDLADALIFMMNNFELNEENPDDLFLNIGTGTDITIKDLAYTIRRIVGFGGEIVWNAAMPDGTPQKLLDVSRINKLGWKATTSLEDGLEKTYRELLSRKDWQ